MDNHIKNRVHFSMPLPLITEQPFSILRELNIKIAFVN